MKFSTYIICLLLAAVSNIAHAAIQEIGINHHTDLEFWGPLRVRGNILFDDATMTPDAAGRSTSSFMSFELDIDFRNATSSSGFYFSTHDLITEANVSRFSFFYTDLGFLEFSLSSPGYVVLDSDWGNAHPVNFSLALYSFCCVELYIDDVDGSSFSSFSNGQVPFSVSAASTTVPVPAAAWLFLAAIGGLGGLRRIAKG